MENSTKIIIGIGITVAIIASGSLLYFYVIKPSAEAKKLADKSKPEDEQSNNGSSEITPSENVISPASYTNFDNLKKNLGSKAIKLSDINAIKVNFGNFYAQFYANSRFAIFRTGTTAPVIMKGSYKNGGIDLHSDSGAVAKGKDTDVIWALNDIVKPSAIKK